MEEKGLSVIITTYNRQAILARTLEALSGQTQLDFQIIIVDDGSTDGTSQWLKKKYAENDEWPRIRIILQENVGQGQARNQALRFVEEGLVLFLGDDVLLSPKALAEHRAAHQHLESLDPGSGPYAVVGFMDWCRSEIKVTPLLEMINTEGHQFGYGEMSPGKEVPFSCFYTSNLSLPREVLGEEPFDRSFTAYGWEDIELGYRLTRRGLRLFYQPSAAGEHLHPMDLLEVFKRQRLVGCGMSTFLELHPELSGNALFLPLEPPWWFPLCKRLIPRAVTVLNSLDRWSVPLSKKLLHRVLMCAYYSGLDEAQRDLDTRKENLA